jgi:hypothetical protein
VHFAVARGSGQRNLELSDDAFEQAVAEAFDTWREVDCGDGRSPAIEVRSAGAVDSDGPFACTRLPERNLDVWSFTMELAGMQSVSPSSGATAGVTRPTFDEDSGQVFDADVRLNELWFAVHGLDERPDLLRVVALHEAGHALGLAHSQEADALMHSSYRVEPGRTLTPDDEEGICALYPPGDASCPPTPEPDAALQQRACDAAFQETLDGTAPQGDGGAAGESGGARRGGCRAGGDGGGSGSVLPALLWLAMGRRRARRARRDGGRKPWN